MDEQQYLLAWGVYAVAALGLLLACFRLSGWMWRYLREPLRLAVCVLLFSPTLIEPGQFAPSIAIIALDLLNVGQHSANALWSLQLCALIALTLYLIAILLRRFWQNLRSGNSSHRASQQAQQKAQQRAQQLRRLQADKTPQPLRVEPQL